MNTSGNKVKVCMIRAHKIIRRSRTNDSHWKRSMASLSRRLAQNQVAAPLRREENESSYGPNLAKIGQKQLQQFGKIFSDF